MSPAALFPRMTKLPYRGLRLLVAASAVAMAVTLANCVRSTPQLNPILPQDIQDQWDYLSDLPWERASTEWLMVGYEGLPTQDGAFFTNDNLKVQERVFEKGLGTYTPSEVVYSLNGEYRIFQVSIGIQNQAVPGKAEARFLIFLDGIQAYASPDLGPGNDAIDLEIPVGTVHELRLVTARTPGATRGALATWGGAKLLKQKPGQQTTEVDPPDGARSLYQAQKQAQLDERNRLDLQASAAIDLISRDLGAGLPSPGQLPPAKFNPQTDTVTVANSWMAIDMGVGGRNQGSLTILDLQARRLLGEGLSVTVNLPGLGIVNMQHDTQPAQGKSYEIAPVSDPALGRGTEVRIFYEARDRQVFITTHVALFSDHPGMLYWLTIDPVAPLTGNVIFRYLEPSSGGFVNVGQRPRYVTDFTRLRDVVATDDGILHSERISWGKPVYLWDAETRIGLLAAVLDETPTPPGFTFRQNPGHVTAQLRVTASLSTGSPGEPPITSPKLYLEPTHSASLQESFAQYRRIIATRYPSLPLPAWVKYQWLSWYVYYMGITEDKLVQQIDTIADNFGDMGPWHVLVDAGWYVAEGRDDADWRTQDWEKLPRGLRWIVDYAHSRGIKVVLYFNAPYVTSRQSPGDWMGLAQIVRDHPDWLIPLDDGESRANYAYNFKDPGFRQYLAHVMEDFFRRYNVDGIKIDGLGNANDAVFFNQRGGSMGLSDAVVRQTLDIYRFIHEQATQIKPDVYIESGWVTPITANPFSHTFRYGDEYPVFSRSYPMLGLVEHIDYAAYQQGLLGQQANMGAVYGDTQSSPINWWWLEAALAMGAQAAISVDLTALTPEEISRYRALLAQYRPFEGTLTLDENLQQQVFGTHVQGSTFVGVLNRSAKDLTIPVYPDRFGLDSSASIIRYDVELDDAIAGSGDFSVTLAPDTFRLFVLRSDPGLLWTNGRVDTVANGAGREYRVLAPPSVEGFTYVYEPELSRASWDGEYIDLSTGESTDGITFSYDGAAGILRISYPQETGTHVLRVEP